MTHTPTRWMVLAAAALFGAAASPNSSRPFAVVAPAPQPGPPVAEAPQAESPPAFTAAPMPDQDFDASAVNPPKSSQVELTPTLFHQKAGFAGDGFVPNSTVDNDEARRQTLRPMGELSLSVPLQ